MTSHVMHPDSRVAGRDVSLTQRLLAAGTAALLGVDAYVHLHDAAQYDQFRSSVMSEGDLFRIQGVVAIVVALAVLIALGRGPRPGRTSPPPRRPLIRSDGADPGGMSTVADRARGTHHSSACWVASGALRGAGTRGEQSARAIRGGGRAG